MELTITIIFIVIALFYAISIFKLVSGFNNVKDFEPQNLPEKHTFTVIIPFRNEAKNLPKLLQSISHQNYDKEKFEIIAIDDFSTDNSQQVFNQWRMQNPKIQTTLLENLHLSNSPKKDAITRAIPITKNTWIITTDGDCELPKKWLKTFDQFIQNHDCEMIAAPVKLKTKNNWFHYFQWFEHLSLQATTIGSFGNQQPFMCNGANFAYTKNFFEKIGGFGGINSYVSGDDVLLLQKAVSKFPEKVAYLKSKSAIVKTNPENKLHKLFMQRVRWAGKSTGYQSGYAKMLALAVFAMNFSLVVAFVLFLFGKINWQIFVALWAIKYVSDYFLMSKGKQFLSKNKFLFPLASSVLYPVFATVVGVYSLFGNFTWKGRKAINFPKPPAK